MIARAFLKALDQIGDPAFRKVLILGFLLTVAVFAGLLFFMIALMPESLHIFDWEWLNSSVDWILGFAAYPMFFIVAWLLFPAVSTVFIGLFLDDIVDAVEAEHYPDRKATRKIGLGETLISALKLSAVIILLNILALPAYLFLFFIPAGPFILYLLLNGYLLGREYFVLVAARHYAPRQVPGIRRLGRDRVFMTGAGITLLFVVPVVNLLAPVLGAAAMVHIFHSINSPGERT